MKALFGKIYHSKVFWAAIVFPGILAGIYFGFGRDMLTNLTNPTAAGHVITISQSNAKSVQAQITASKLPVFFELCTPDVCKIQSSELEKVAAKHDGKILFVQADPGQAPDLFGVANRLTGVSAVPMALLITPDGNVTALAGVNESDEIEAFIKDSLESKVIKVNPANAQRVQQDVAKAGLPVLYVLCTPDLCKSVNDGLNAVAEAYKGKVTIVEINPVDSPPMAARAAQAVGAFVYPAYIFVNPKAGTAVPAAGVMDEAGLKKFIDAALAAKAPDTKADVPTEAPAPPK
jgi:thioredoxin-like negative regulator of GroEL